MGQRGKRELAGLHIVDAGGTLAGQVHHDPISVRREKNFVRGTGGGKRDGQPDGLEGAGVANDRRRSSVVIVLVRSRSDPTQHEHTGAVGAEVLRPVGVIRIFKLACDQHLSIGN